jgi:hypothetical protein
VTRGIVNDLSGMRFGHLQVKHRNGSDAQNNALWLCRCDCGNEASIRGNFLNKQRFCSKQCRLYREPMRVDITGKRFGELVAVDYIRSTKSGQSVWAFKCDCGTLVNIVHSNVLTGRTKRCRKCYDASRIKHGLSQTLEYHREAHRKWAKENPAKVIANAMKRNRAFRKRIPQWLTEEHWLAINAFYLEAERKTKETGIKHHVDHIHPLRGKTVSGLHVPWNLQVLTRDENLQKAAKL